MSIEDLIKQAKATVITDEDIVALNARLDNFEFIVSKPIDLELTYNI